MEKSCLARYDEIFFNKERIGILIDELLLSGSILTLKALEAVMCAYIRFRVRELSNSYPMSIPMSIDVNTIHLGSADANYFLKRVEYVAKELELSASIQMANNKIYISLY